MVGWEADAQFDCDMTLGRYERDIAVIDQAAFEAFGVITVTLILCVCVDAVRFDGDGAAVAVSRDARLCGEDSGDLCIQLFIPDGRIPVYVDRS